MNRKNKLALIAACVATLFIGCKSDEPISQCNLKPKENFKIVNCEYVCSLPPKVGYNIGPDCEYVCALPALPGYNITDSCTYVAIEVAPDTIYFSISTMPQLSEKIPAIEALLSMNNVVIRVDFKDGISATTTNLHEIMSRYVDIENSALPGKLVTKWSCSLFPPNGQQELGPGVLDKLLGTNTKISVPFGANEPTGDKYLLDSQYLDYALGIGVDTTKIKVVYPSPESDIHVTDSATLRAAVNQMTMLLAQQSDIIVNLDGNGNTIILDQSNSNLADLLAELIKDPRVLTQSGAFSIKALGYNVPVRDISTLARLAAHGLLAQHPIGEHNHFKLKNSNGLNSETNTLPDNTVVQVERVNASSGIDPTKIVPDTLAQDGIFNVSSLRQLLNGNWQNNVVFVPGLTGGQYPLGGVGTEFIENAEQPSIPKSGALFKFIGDQILAPYGETMINAIDWQNGYDFIDVGNRTLAWIVVSNNLVNDETKAPLPVQNPAYRSLDLTTSNPNYMDDDKLLISDVDISRMVKSLCRGITKMRLNNVKMVLTDPTLINLYNNMDGSYILSRQNIDNSSTNVEVVVGIPDGKQCFPLNNVSELLNGISVQQAPKRPNAKQV
jgi:hypothetical protein